MGYAFDVALSIPMALIIYILSKKAIISSTVNDKFEDRIQKSFIIGFIIGLTYIALGMSVFDESSNIHNKSLQYGLYIGGTCLILNSVLFSWDNLDDTPKILILCISIVGMIIYSYQKK